MGSDVLIRIFAVRDQKNPDFKPFMNQDLQSPQGGLLTRRIGIEGGDDALDISLHQTGLNRSQRCSQGSHGLMNSGLVERNAVHVAFYDQQSTFIPGHFLQEEVHAVQVGSFMEQQRLG
ncbi:hypothetical protein SDC9_132639 [bioreactor metagenome]|uniref:Uncharacterized protein n=1 Tax=bioreactor metagenome TaxID=1076179 RepID=A0A645D930_9ZZZZ